MATEHLLERGRRRVVFVSDPSIPEIRLRCNGSELALERAPRGHAVTGPISEAALVHCLTATSVVVLMEMLGDGSTHVAILAEGLRLQGRQAVAERSARGSASSSTSAG